MLITDTTVNRLHGDVLRASFAEQGLPLPTYAIEPGEATKNRVVKGLIEDWMVQQGSV